MDWDTIEPVLVAAAVGLLIGFEREWSQRDRSPRYRTAGSRTFALLAIAGAVAASFEAPWVIAASALGATVLIAIGYVRTADSDPGLTTQVAALTTFLIGALAWTDSDLAVATAVLVAGLLASKSWLHHFAREKVTEAEVDDALRFFLLAFVILPILADEQQGPYGVLNPFRIWLFVVVLTGVSWFGYIAVRSLGRERGMLVAGFASGFISASATTATMGRRARSVPLHAPLAGALAASVATMVQMAVVVGVADSDTLARLAPALALGGVFLAVEAIGVQAMAGGQIHAGRRNETDGRPFLLLPILGLTALLTAALLLGRWLTDVLGEQGIVVASAATGLADAQSGGVAASELAARSVISTNTAVIAAGVSLATNTVTKCVLAFAAGGKRFGTAFVALLAVPVLVTAAAIATAVTL